MHPKAGEFLELCQSRYYDDPVLFSEEVIGITLTPQQVEALSLLAKGKHKLAVKSGHKQSVLCPLARNG